MRGPPEQWDAAIKEGIAANRMALAYLKKQAIVQVDRIGIMGLSEGGLVAMWTLFGIADFKAAVLISPANISRSPSYWFKLAYLNLNVDTIRSPVFLAVGKNDIPIIKLNCRLLIPKMKDLNNPFEYKYYPGDHAWFKTIRAELWEDTIDFLKANLTK